MPPTIILIRHAEARHNLTKDSQIPDPALTDQGIDQCKPLRESLLHRFSHLLPLGGDSNNAAAAAGTGGGVQDVAIIASPMRRTLQTAQLGLDWLIDKGVKVEADADWQENSAKPCDTGSPIPAIAKDFPAVDFSSVDPVFPDKTSPAGQPYYYRRDAILARGERCLAKLASRPERFIFVVSHAGFLRLGVVGWWFFNADYRIFDFDEPSESGKLTVKQHDDTVGGGLGWSWDQPVVMGEGLPEEDPVKEDGQDSVV